MSTKYNLYRRINWYKNQLEGFPVNFVTSEDLHIPVGVVNIPDVIISKLHCFEDRWESGVRLYLPKAIRENAKDCFDNNVEYTGNSWGRDIEMEMFRKTAEDARFFDADLYLGHISSSCFTGKKDLNTILCFEKGKNIESVLNKQEKRLFGSGFSKVGEIEKVPIGLLKKKDRFIVDSGARSAHRENVSSQILIPHESKFNHACYGLGRYDNF